MKLIRYGIIGVISALVVSATAVNADPKPKNAKATDSQTVANFYAGTSRVWSTCNGGGVYFGAGWEAKAYCNKNSPSVGWGTWSVRNGVICHDLVWYWKEDGQTKTHKGDQGCIAHLTDAEGTIWRRWNDDKDWWRLQPIKDDKKASKGFKFKSKFNRTKKKKGV